MKSPIELVNSEFNLADLPFTLRLNPQNPLKPGIILSLDLKEYISSFLTYNQNRTDLILKEKYKHYRTTFRSQFVSCKAASYFEQIIDQLFLEDIATRNKIKDTFAYHYLSEYFLEIWCNTMDEVLQMHGLSNNYESVVAVLEIIVEQPSEGQVSISLIDRSGRGFPMDFLIKMNEPLQHKDYLLASTRSHKKFDRFAFVCLTEDQMGLLKRLLPEYKLPSGIQIKEVSLNNYKNMLFTSVQFDSLIDALKSLEDSSHQQEILNQLLNTEIQNEVNFGGRGLGFRLLEWLVEFNVTFDPIKKTVRPNKYLLDYSSLQVKNLASNREGLLDAAIIITTSDQSYSKIMEESCDIRTPEAKSLDCITAKFNKKLNMLDQNTCIKMEGASGVALTYDPFEMTFTNEVINESLHNFLTQNTTPDNTTNPSPSLGTPMAASPFILKTPKIPKMEPLRVSSPEPARVPLEYESLNIKNLSSPMDTRESISDKENSKARLYNKPQKVYSNSGLFLMQPHQWLETTTSLLPPPTAPNSRFFSKSSKNSTPRVNGNEKEDASRNEVTSNSRNN